MARSYANIFTAIWRDPDWRALDRGDQQFYVLLVTQPNISAAGMLPMTTGRWAAMADDSTADTIQVSLRKLAAARFIAVDEMTEELLVRSFVRHDNGYGNRKRRVVIESAAGEIESRTLRQVLAVELVRLGLPSEWTREAPVELPGQPGEVSGVDCGGFRGDADSQEPASVEPPVDNAVETAFSQVDRLSAKDGEAIPDLVTSDRVVDTSTLNPQPSTRTPADSTIVKPRWIAADIPPAQKLIPHNPPHAGRQGGLFATTNVKISDREQVILDWLRANGYLEATHGDAKAVDNLARKVFSGKGVGYLRGVACGTGFGNLYEQMRQERAKAVEEKIRQLERSEPACAHGTLAGNAMHPTHGTMLCPQCRAGIPAVADEPTTAPAVSAALDAYRRDFTGALTTVDLISLTQQAAALHAQGATEHQLTVLASSAARTGVGLLTAATRKDS